jgi:hypothetical protein
VAFARHVWGHLIAGACRGPLDAAITALRPVLALVPGERTAVQVQRMSALRAELAQPIFRGSPQSREPHEQAADFAPGELGRMGPG